MSRTVDDRVVEMKFDNKSFEAGVNSTLQNLDKFKSKLNFAPEEKHMQDLQRTSESVFSKLRNLFDFSAPKQGLQQLQQSVSSFSAAHISEGIEGVSKKFLAMSTIAITALTQITQQAIATGTQLAKSFTVDPIKSGLKEYETNLNSIQTILANTEVSGATLDDVNAALDELNHFSDQTIYNFSQMTKNIGTFTAAGVDLKLATESIKGIATLAALSGSSAEQASGAMYQLSQAISAGKVSLQDWNSVVNAGMGGTVFQRALANTAIAMGKLEESSVTLDGAMKNVKINGDSFRNSIDATKGPSWLTSDVLTQTLRQFTGDLSDAEVAAMGFNEEQVKAIQQTAQTAFKAATEVKTLSGVLDTARESAGSGWAKTWQLIFGDFAEAKSSFTNLSNFLNGMIGRSADARNAMFGLWKEMGGRDVAIDALKAGFQSLLTILQPIKDALGAVFPAKTGEDIYNLTVRIRQFAENMAISSTTANNLKLTFLGVFSAFKLVHQIVGALFRGVQSLFGSEGLGSTSILSITGQLGAFVAQLQRSGAVVTIIQGAFRLLGDILAPVKEAFNAVFGDSGSGLISFRRNLLELIKAFAEFMSTVQLSETAGNFLKRTFLGVFSIFKIGIDVIKTLLDILKETFGGGTSGGILQGILGITAELGIFIQLLQRSGAIVDIIRGAFRLLGEVLKPIGQAFRDIFPKGDDDPFGSLLTKLLSLVVAFGDFVSTLKVSETASENIRRTFRGVFAVFSIGIEIVKQLFRVIGNLVGSNGLGNPGRGILDFTAKIGDFLVKVNEAVKSGEGFTAFFDKLEAVIRVPLNLIGALGAAIGKLFGFSTDTSAISDGLTSIKDGLSPLEKFIDKIGQAWDSFVAKLKNSGIDFSQIGSKIQEVFSGIGTAIGEVFANADYSDILDTINTGLFLGLVLLFKKFTTNGLGLGIGDLIGSIKDRFDALTASTKAMTTQVNAKTLLIIAGAIGILTASVFVLASIDAVKLQSALGAMVVGFGSLLVAMGLLIKISASAGFAKVPLVAASMILLAAALLILTFAVKKLAELDQEELKKGLIGVAALLLSLAATSVVLSAASGGMIRAGAGILLLSVALLLLQKSVTYFSNLDYETMKRGLIGIAGTLVAIGLAMRLMPTGMVLQAAAILILAAALKILATAVVDFAEISWSDMVHGLVGVAGALVAIAVGMQLMPKGMLLQAAALVILAAALKIIAGVVADMGALPWSVIGKGLLTLAATMLILVVALNAMSGALPGAIAMVVVSGALKILAGVLETLGNMKISEIVTALLALAGAFVLIGAAGLILTPLVPSLIGLGVAIALIGAGAALAGLGLLAFANGVAILVAVGGAAVALLGAFLAAVIVAIPAFLAGLAKGIIAFVTTIAEGTPRIIVAFVKILEGLLEAVIKVSPKLFKAMGVLLEGFIKFILKYAPKLAEAALKLLISFLDVFARQIGPVANSAANLIIKFAEALGKQAPRLAMAALQLLVDLLNGIAKAIEKYLPQIIQAGYNIGAEIVKGMIKGLAYGPIALAKGAIDVGKKALGKLGGFLGISSPSKKFIEVGRYCIEGFIIGLSNLEPIDRASQKLGDRVLVPMSETIAKVADLASKEVNLNPVIAPVIDLTNARKGAADINALLAATTATPNVSFDRASTIVAQRSADQRKEIMPNSPVSNQEKEPTYQFVQNNISPKALSTAEIYRNTQNQLALAREAN